MVFLLSCCPGDPGPEFDGGNRDRPCDSSCISQEAKPASHGTNREKRAFARFVGINGDRKNVPLVEALLPSGAAWVHNWLWTEALPRLLTVPPLRQLKFVTTDQDELCIGAINKAIGAKLLGDSQIRLCAWHKVRNSCLQQC